MTDSNTAHFRRMFMNFLDQEQSTTEEQSGTIIAGTGSDEKQFSVLQSALERSPVIKGWIEDKDSIPTSVQKNGALCFAECDPEVVQVTIEYMKSIADGPIAILDTLGGGGKDVLFYVKLYKFALCLGLSELCAVSLHNIKELARNTASFLSVLSAATEEKTNLVEDRPFNDWIMGHMTKKSEVLRESNLFKSRVMQDSELAWKLCSLLMSSLGAMPFSTASQLPTPPMESFLKTTPELERQKRPYSHKLRQESPTPRQDANRVKKPQKKGVRKYNNPTVEEVVDQEDLTHQRGPDT